jgi:hypothetical protein
MYAGPWRHARSLTVSATCVALAAAGHLAGGGAAPDLRHAPVAAVGLAVVTALLWLALGGASRHRWTFGRAVLAMAVTQAALHTAFTLVLVPTSHRTGQATGSMPGMAAGPHAAGAFHGVSMTVGHTAAAVAVAAVIARTDSALAASFSLAAARARTGKVVQRVVRGLRAGARSAAGEPGEWRRAAPAWGAWLPLPALRQRADGRGPSRRGPPLPV